MAINGQTLTLKLSLTLPSLITQSGTALHTLCWISKLLKIEGTGQIDFCGYQLLLLTQSENMIGKHRPSPLHLWGSTCDSLFLMGCWFQRPELWLPELADADPPLCSWHLWIQRYQSFHWFGGFSCFVFAINLWCIFSPSTTPQCLSLHYYLDCPFCKSLWIKCLLNVNVFTFLDPSTILLFVYVCFPSFVVTSLPRPSSEPFLVFPTPQTTRPRLTTSCHSFYSDTIPLTPARWLVFFPSFIFLSTLFFWPCALFILSISLQHWPLGSTEQNWFRVFHGSWMRQQLCNRGWDGERKRVNK